MRSRLNILAWTILVSVFVGMSIYLTLNPTRTGVVPNYRFAATHWWDGTSMYPGGTHGFLYAPPFAVLFSPLNVLRPEILGEIVWRSFGFGLFACGLWILSKWPQRPGALQKDSNLCRDAGPASGTFLTIALLSVPASLASLNNGQTNLPLSACLVLTALTLRDQRWNLAALLLSLSLVLKPIALAPWLLAFAVLPAMRTPLLIGLPALALVGFLHPNPSYAWGEWVEFFVKLGHSYTPENLRVSDIFGAIDRAGVQIPPMLEKATRAGACLTALVWVWQSYRKTGIYGASWALWVATALVFTIFNPRAETNSYVLISPLLAYAAISYWRDGEAGRWKGAVLAAACIGLMCDGMGLWIYKATDVWFKPLIVLLLSPLLFRVPEAWRLSHGR
ncbi:MAG: glycosyltransferase family 87 protein [Verrucomicrobiota bacterium]